MNPYDFVQLSSPARRESVQGRGHNRFAGLSGRLTCRLTAETHLFVPEHRAGSGTRSRRHEHLRFCHDKRTPIIPGTSLKGVLRSVAEAVSGSCFIYDSLVYDRRTSRYDLPRGYRHCTDIDHLCPACRMFGLLNRRDVFSGLVTVSDARVIPDTFQRETLTLAILSTPKPRHRVFYASAPQSRQPRGRKFYYHHPPQAVSTRTRQDGQNKTVDAAQPGAVFTFEVEYTNLAEAELALLLYAVALEPEMRHKIGMGKPIGLGSTHIEITGWQRLDRQARYRTLDGGWETVAEQAVIGQVVQYIQQHSGLLKAVSQADLQRIWHWPPDPTISIHYPSQGWFRDNLTASLEDAP